MTQSSYYATGNEIDKNAVIPMTEYFVGFCSFPLEIWKLYRDQWTTVCIYYYQS